MLKVFCSSKKMRESKFSSVLFCRWNEGIAAGQSRPKSAPAFRPRYCFLDKKVLRFFAYFQEVAGLDDRAPEKRIRHVHILYHLEDDSISILEPRTNVIISSFISMYHCISPISILHTKQFSLQNSGLFQGMLLKRHRIPKREPIHGDRAYWHWTDLRIGSIADIYSKKYHICSSDEFTRKYLESEGIHLDDNVPGKKLFSLLSPMITFILLPSPSGPLPAKPSGVQQKTAHAKTFC